MKNSKKCLMLIVLTAAVSVAVGQPGPKGSQQGVSFSMLDLNGDGVVTEQEFNQARADFVASRAAEGRPMRNAANAPGFEQLDIDGDGMLKPEELATARQLRQAAGGGMRGQGKGGPVGMGRNRPSYAYFDLNHDGVVEEHEFIEARNQRISERASQGYAMRGLSNMRSFQELDTDGDGKLSEQEFAAARAAHQR